MMARIIIVANVLAILSSFIEQIGVSRSFPAQSACIQPQTVGGSKLVGYTSKMAAGWLAILAKPDTS